MATHSSILAWKIPWTEEPGGLQSMGSQRVRHDSTYIYVEDVGRKLGSLPSSAEPVLLLQQEIIISF